MNFKEAKAEYLKAKAEYDRILKLCREVNAELDRLYEKGEISLDEWAEKTTENEFKLGLDAASEKLSVAGDRLIEAGRAALEPLLTNEQREKIKEVWSCIYVKHKLIDVLLRHEL